MKKLNLFLSLALACGVGFGLAQKQNTLNENADASHISEGVLNWDAERKLIYANQNNLLIVEDGEGTTVYLDSGELGMLDANDKSLADLHTASPECNQDVPPADGSDLSEWSIVFGLENYTGSVTSSVPAKITMNGGKIANIYAGHSALAHETNNVLKGDITFTMNGGEVSKIFTDNGYEQEGFVGKAYGTDVVFNLFGGTVESVERIRPNVRDEFNSFVNLKGDIKITDGITFVNQNSGTGLKVVGAFSNTASVAIKLNSYFERSDKLFELDESVVNSFDADVFELKNKPANSADWNVYVNQSKYVRFGIAQKIESVALNGVAQVGQTLQVEVLPENATISEVVWFRVNDFLGNSSVIGTGESYTLKPEDGGKKVYAEIFDKNDDSAKWRVETATVVQRVDLPEVVTVTGKTTIYANGNDLIIVGTETGTTVFLDAGVIGVRDELDVSLKDAGIANAFENNSDLSKVTISAGSSNDKNSGDISITLLSGKIQKITASSTNGGKLTEGMVVNLFGGVVENVAVSKTDVKIYAIVNISGNVQTTIAGVQNEFGATKINVIGSITSPSKAIKIVLDKNLIDSTDIISSDSSIDTTKFAFVDKKGDVLSTFKIVATNTGIMLDAIDATDAKIKGELKKGKVVSADVDPANANVTYSWFTNTKNSLEGAKKIENADGKFYTLSKEDVGKYVILVLNYGTENEIVVVSEDVVKNRLSAFAIIMIVFAGVVVSAGIAVVVWFVLWKKKVCGANFMAKLFEKIDGVLFKKQDKKK